MSKRTILFFLGMLLFDVCAGTPSPVAAVDVGRISVLLSPLERQVVLGAPLTTTIRVKGNGYTWDAATVSLSFPEDTIEVAQITPADPRVSLADVVFDNDRGNIHLRAVGRGDTPEISIATITFRTKRVGTARIELLKKNDVSFQALSRPIQLAPAVYTIVTQPRVGATIGERRQSNPLTVIRSGEAVYNTISATSTFRGNPPVLRGLASVPGAELAFDVDQGLAEGTTVANGAGEWEWTLPRGLLPGTYSVEILTFGLYTSSVPHRLTEQVHVEIFDAARALFRLFIHPHDERIKPGEAYIYDTEIRYGSDETALTHSIPLLLSWKVFDPDQFLIEEDEATTLLDQSKARFEKSVLIPADAVPGRYTLVLEMRGENGEIIAEATTSFSVIVIPWARYGVVAGAVVFIGVGYGISRYAHRRRV